jgi:ABC-type Fe3+-siderophore transport system permease subunit
LGRQVLVGNGTWFGTTALTTLLVVRANPWDTPRIFTWLSGSTYNRSWDQVLPVLGALVGLVVAPHAPRALVSGRRLHVVPVARAPRGDRRRAVRPSPAAPRTRLTMGA